jgi:purine catabolism regulator
MTTGLGLADHPNRFEEFVRTVAASQAAVLAVAIGGNLEAIPASGVALADELSLPLVELPWQLRFSELTELVLGYALDRQNALLRKSEDVNRLFTTVVLEGGGMPELRQAAERLLGRGVRVLNRWMEPADGGGPSSHRDEAVASVTISVGGSELGAMTVDGGLEHVSDFERRIVGHAATAAGLIFMRERAIAEAEVRSEGEFLAQLCAGWGDSSEVLRLRSAALGLAVDGLYTVVYLGATSASEPQSTSVIPAFRSVVDRVLRGRRQDVLQAWSGAEVALLIARADRPAYAFAKQLVSDAQVLVRMTEDPTLSVRAGVSREVKGLLGVATAFREARAAYRIGRSRTEAVVSDYRTLGAYPALYEASTGSGASSFRELHQRFIRPLEEYSERWGVPLVLTLGEWLAAGGNASATARRLGVNRQSLLHRLNRIEALTGCDLAAADDRFALELALRTAAITGGSVPQGNGRHGAVNAGRSVAPPARRRLPAVGGEHR